jgi:hypothetical protein
VLCDRLPRSSNHVVEFGSVGSRLAIFISAQSLSTAPR